MQLSNLPRFSRTLRFVGVGAFPLTLALVGACGDSGTEPTDTGLPFEQFGDAYRDAQCARAVTCQLMPDAGTCKTALRSDSWVAEAVAGVAFGDLTYDPKAGKSCVDTLQTFTCESFDLIPKGVREVCDPVFGGRFAAEAACKSTAECEGVDAVCEGACGGGCCEGVCKGAAAAAQEGEECSEIIACGTDLRCQFDETLMMTVCQPLAGPNEPCAPGQCVDGYACGPDAKCFKQALTGAQCNPLLPSACASRAEYCHDTDKKCVRLPASGEACAVSMAGGAVCAAYAFCNGETCETLPAASYDCYMQSACLGSLECSGDPDFLCLPLPGPDVCLSL